MQQVFIYVILFILCSYSVEHEYNWEVEHYFFTCIPFYNVIKHVSIRRGRTQLGSAALSAPTCREAIVYTL